MRSGGLVTKMLLLAVLLAGGYLGVSLEQGASREPVQDLPLGNRSDDTERVERAFRQRFSDIQVSLGGQVARLLPDDLKGSRHQRFIVRLTSGQTLLVAHNIDLAPRIEGIAVDDRVELFGVYEWNDKGGVIHWTHRDPRGSHMDGWIRHQGRLYQ